MEKEFGKLTHDQFACLVSRLPELRGQMREFPQLLREKQDRFHEVFGAGGYPQPFVVSIAESLLPLVHP